MAAGDANRQEQLRHAALDIDWALEHVDRFLRLVEDMRGGIAGGGGGSRGAPGESDPTSRYALTSDPAREDHRRFGQLAGDLQSQARALRSLVESWVRPRPGKPTGEAPPGCEHHQRVLSVWAPPRSADTHADSEVAQITGRALLLCRWCSDHTRADRRLPTRAEMEAHAQGRRPKRRAG